MNPQRKADHFADFDCFTPDSGPQLGVACRGNFDPKASFGDHFQHRLYKRQGMAEGRSMLMMHLVSEVVLDTAYDWLCRRRRGYPTANSMMPST
jgi:hypothetical protein